MYLKILLQRLNLNNKLHLRFSINSLFCTANANKTRLISIESQPKKIVVVVVVVIGVVGVGVHVVVVVIPVVDPRNIPLKFG